jgi:hypothetical protein
MSQAFEIISLPSSEFQGGTSMSRTDLLHWCTTFYVLPACIHNTIAARLIARALADDDPRPVTRAELLRLAEACRASVTSRRAA